MPWCLSVNGAVPLWQRVDAYDTRTRKQKEAIGVHRWGKSSKSQVVLRRFTKAGKTVGYFMSRYALETWIKAGAVETVDAILSPAKPGTSEDWYRDKLPARSTGLISNENGVF